MSRPPAGRALLLLLGLLAVGLALGLARPPAAGPVGAEPVQAGEGREQGGGVLLELFTSQGCSSCPPADRLLSELAEDPELEGRVFALAFHVDYWNYIGWTDPFSSPRWSQRQREYARVLEDGRVYTPQLVVDGKLHRVGSRRGAVGRAVREALATAPAARLEVTAGTPRDGRLPVEVRVRPAAPGETGPTAPGEPLELWLALWQDGLTTPVGRGENADRTLHNDRVVRRLVKLGGVEPGGRAAAPGAQGRQGTRPYRGEVTLEPDWPLADLGVVVFLQAPGSRRIHGTAGTSLHRPGRRSPDTAGARPTP